MLTFSNPRLVAEFDNWNCGGFTGKCRFQIEYRPKLGYRVLRTTTNRNGGWNKPKMSRYAGITCIVDGSDGKTYILQHIPNYRGVHVMAHDFMSVNIHNNSSTVYAEGDITLFASLFKLISQANAPQQVDQPNAV